MYRRCCRLLLLVALGACSTLSPHPDEMAARVLPVAASGIDRAGIEQRENAAMQAMAAHRYDDAAQMAREILDLDPRSARARGVLGISLLQQSKAQEPPDLAMQSSGDGETLTAVGLAPADPVVGLLRARFLAGVGHLSAAAAAAEDCLARNAATGAADYVGLLAAAAEYTYELGEEQRALPHVRALLERRPDDATQQFRLGVCLLRTATDVDGAIAAAAAFQRSAALAPGDDDAALAVVAARMQARELARRSGKDENAVEQLRAARTAAVAVAASFPASARAAFYCGVTAEADGDSSAARAAYEAALASDASHLGSTLNLAALCASAGEERAAELWRRALAIDAEHGGLTADERRRVRAELESH